MAFALWQQLRNGKIEARTLSLAETDVTVGDKNSGLFCLGLTLGTCVATNFVIRTLTCSDAERVAELNAQLGYDADVPQIRARLDRLGREAAHHAIGADVLRILAGVAATPYASRRPPAPSKLSSAKSKQGQPAAHRCKLGAVVVICPNRPFSRRPNRD
jgi:hypothetical protein